VTPDVEIRRLPVAEETMHRPPGRLILENQQQQQQ
jgi:hypothetical protein